MSVTRVIQYRTKPDQAEQNQRLIEAVFAELAQANPAGLTYSSYRLADGVSFVHVVTLPDDANPLDSIDAFAEFQAGIAERCEDGPHPSVATVIGSYTG